MFSTVTDVRLALTPGAVADDTETAASLTDYQLTDAIREADGIVKTYLGRYYVVDSFDQDEPSQADINVSVTVNAAAYPVRGWSRDIAAFLAALTFRKHKDLTEDDPIRLRYGMAMANLDLVRQRQIILDPSDFPAVSVDSSQSGVFVENTYEGTLFAPEDFRLVPGGVPSPQALWPFEQR